MAANLTRRGALKAGAAAGIATIVLDALAGCTNPATSGSTDPVVVEKDDATKVIETFSEIDLRISEGERWELPLGSVLHPAEGVWIPALCTGDSADSTNKACAMSSTSGMLLDVVPEHISQGTTWAIFDARCSDQVFAWTEIDIIERNWVLYASQFADGALAGEPVKLWEADRLYDPPLVCCTGNQVLWLVMPNAKGELRTEHSFCYQWKVGESKANAVVESPGRFATAPAISGDTITLVPRVRADEGVYYGITAYSLTDNLRTIVDQLVLPVSVRPMNAVRIGETFVFSIEANYSSGGLLGQMGTYIGTGTGPFVMFEREPFAEVVGTQDEVYVIKSRSSYFVVDVPHKTYSILTAADHCVDYGEYPAREGETTSFVTFATLKSRETGYPSSVVVRTFDLASGLSGD